MKNYVVLMTAYNEEKNIEECILRILKQNLKPKLILIVDDGSKDRTSEIINKFPQVKSIKINLPKYNVASFNMVRALNIGYKEILKLSIEYNYILKIDADSYIPPDYVKTLIYVMEKNPKLGIVSGGINGSNIWEHRASDGARLYRIDCWNDINGLDFVIHWDTHAILKAYMKGWMVRTLNNIQYEEVRTHERSNLYQWYLSGIARFYLGFPLLHTFLVFVIYVNKYPFLIGSATMFFTHLIYLLTKKGIFNKEYNNFLKEFSKKEIKIRLEKSLHLT